MHNRYLLFISALILFVFAGGLPARAVVSRLDTSFGLNGRVAVELGMNNSAHAVVVQPDGKIVIAGSSSNDAALDFSLLRFNKDGSLDTTFNGDGSILTSVSVDEDEALALALLPDGRIIAAGYSSNGVDRDFAMVCYLEDGSLDRSFGKDGVVITPIGNENEEITAITINSEGLITVAGATEGTVGRVLVAARYFADGELDRSFGEQGLSLFGVGEDVTVEGMIERTDGTYVISGSYKEKGVVSLVLVGLTIDGMLADRFGEQGVAVPSGMFGGSEGYGVVEDSNGLIYVAGSVGITGKHDAALFRFTRAGKVDTLFGDRGVVVNRASEEDDVLYAVVVGKSGLVASGYTTEAGTRQLLLTTYTNNDLVPVLTATSKAAVVRGKRVESDATDVAPVQEVWESGETKVQLRRLQVSPSLVDYLTVYSGPSFFLPESEDGSTFFGEKAVGQQHGDRTFFSGMIASAFQQCLHFLLPSAVAADSGGVAYIADGTISAQALTVPFSEGASVGYAITTDEEGNIVVVGTAHDATTSSMVAARYVAETAATGSGADYDGHANPSVATTAPADVTKTTAVTGGEIAEGFGKTVIRRGVVFSTHQNPEYTDSSDEQGISAAPPEEGVGVTDTNPSSTITTDASDTPLYSDSAPSGSTYVEKGERNGGSGHGAFSIGLENLKPGTIYYIRAYALTDGGEVSYGNALSFRTADACFVATASYGTLLHPAVMVLRNFRDTFLVHSVVGRRLVDLYYAGSPPIADWIAQSGVLRFIVRLLLLPFIGFSWLALKAGIGATLLTVCGIMMIITWFSARRFVRR